MALRNAFADLALDTSVQALNTTLTTGVRANPENIIGKFRDAFETFTPGNKWNISQASGDIVQLDGNALSASYLVISSDPLTTGGVTTLESTDTYTFPLEVAVGLSLSQRVLGQELAVEIVSTETSLSPYADAAIASIQQSTTTLTVTTTVPHDLVPGKRISIYGVTSDSRLNYPALVVAATPSATQFICTAGPGGTIPSLTVGPYNNQGYVYFRSALGYAQNGISEIFENATATNASAYSRSAAGDALPSGTLTGNHSITTSSTGATQGANSAYTYAFLPGAEFRYILQADRVQWLDALVDSTSQPSSRALRTQVVPDPTKEYKLRIRATNNKGLTIPTAKIVSATKSGSTTATITTATAHGLTTGDQIVIYGNRDQTNFANLTTATTVASTPSSTTFTIAYGASATATTYGGMVARVNGGNIPASFTTVAIQSAAVASGELTLVGSANWTWLIGDYVNVYGVRNNTTGGDLEVDGTYKVVNVSTTTMVLAPIGSTALPAPFTTTNCGGTVIKRTDARISFVRIFDYLRERVEVQANGAQSASVPVVGTVSVNGGSNIVPYNQNTYALVTSTNLGASATYTQSAVNLAASTTSGTTYYTAVNVSVQHTAGTAPGILYFEVGSETSSTAPTTWYPQFVVPIPSNASWQTFTFPLTTRYYRLRFVNGSTAQTSFRLATMSIYNGALGNNLTYPDYLLIPLSSTALGSSATFTGPTLDFGDSNRIYKTLTATVFADQASATNGLNIQVSRDGTTWRDATTATVSANSLTSTTADLIYRYARVIYTNGAVAQGTFNLDCQAGV